MTETREGEREIDANEDATEERRDNVDFSWRSFGSFKLGCGDRCQVYGGANASLVSYGETCT